MEGFAAYGKAPKKRRVAYAQKDFYRIIPECHQQHICVRLDKQKGDMKENHRIDTLGEQARTIAAQIPDFWEFLFEIKMGET